MPNYNLVLMMLLSALLLVAGRVDADLEVNARKDKVILNDGTVVECIVVMTTTKGTLVVIPANGEDEQPRQEIIPAEKIKEIVKGKDEGRKQGFTTERVVTQKVVQGTGFRKTKPKKEEKGFIAPTNKLVKADPAIEPKTTQTQTAASGEVGNSGLTPKQLQELYFKRFPQLKQWSAQLLGKAEYLEDLIAQAQAGNLEIRNRLNAVLEALLKQEMKSRAGSPGELETGVKAQPGTQP